jgi:O-antigen/teichoic acid export membrane protein
MSSNRKSHAAAISALEPAADDVFVAIRSALTLGTSLIVTWSVALVVRFFLPRYLGPERFGTFSFADSFTVTFFVVLGLGAETYIQKEIPVRQRHASDFFGGFIVLRLLMSAFIFAAMAIVMALAHRPPAVQQVVFIFGATQFLGILNGNLAALLHASSNVGELAVINVAAKLLWGVGVGLSVLAHLGVHGLAFTFLIAEAARTISLLPLVRRYLGIRIRWNPKAVRMVVVASFPFYLNQVANTIYAKVDVSLLSMLSNDTEVGWYGSASNLAGLSFLISPLVGWVLLPLLSRAAARSELEMFAILRRAIRVILMLVLPIALLLGIGADVWIGCLYGSAFAPATLCLRVLAPMFVITYLAMIAATCLTLLERAWTVTAISIAGLAVDLILNILLVPLTMRRLGPGGAGAGAAAAVVITEFGVTAALIASIGARAFDRASALAIGKTALCGLLVVVADAMLRPLGPARLAVDAVAYIVLIFALGAARVEETRQLVGFMLRTRRRHAIS